MADPKKYRKIRNKMTKDAVLRERAATRDYERGIAEQAKLPRAKAGTGAKIQKRKELVSGLKKVRSSKISADSGMDKEINKLDKLWRRTRSKARGVQGVSLGGGTGSRR